ncbi:MAG: thiamine pyrophosphate-dependent enzyme [Beutenbergiaceae bacterium]
MRLLRRRDVVLALVADRGELLVVAGLGAAAWDITAAGDHPGNFPMWGAMGSAVPIAIGLALAQPKRPVLCLTGDGEMLMGIGSLAVAGVMAPPNLTIVVLDNERYGETGMQPTHTASGVDLAAVASGFGIEQAQRIEHSSQLAPLREAIHARRGPRFAVVKIDPEKLPLVLPPRETAYLKNRMRIEILGADEALNG